MLSCKVFKAIMLTAMQSDQFATRLRRVYVRILLRTHFQAVRTHCQQAQQERQERVGAVEAGRKRAALRFLRGVVGRKRQQGSK